MGERRKARRADQRGIQRLVDPGDDLRELGVARRDAGHDRGLALAAVVGERAHVALRLAHRAAMAGPEQLLAAPAQFGERGHVVAHRSVGRGDDRGRPRHHVIARKQSIFRGEGEGHVVGRVAGRRDRLERIAAPGDDLAVVERAVGRIGGIMRGVEAARRAVGAGRRPVGAGADDRRAGRRAERRRTFLFSN